MNRDEIKSSVAKMVEEGGWSVRHESIADPGRFEGEPVEILYYHDAMMNGCADESGDDWDAFRVDDEERAAFGLDKETGWAVLESSEQGFFALTYASDREFQAFSTEPESFEE